ncbi:MAG: hypothetical protein ABQ298_11250 [Puniceicoccaceae bacterium]
MNRSILLVICDFLLLSLLALARFDAPVTDDSAEVEAEGEVLSPEAELVDILKLSLQAEREAQAALAAELEQSNLSIEEKESLLANTNQNLEQTQQMLERERKQKQELMEQREMLQQEKGDLAQNLLSLREQNILERERLRLAQEKIEAQQQDLEQSMQTVSQIAEEKERLAQEKQQIETELKVAEARQVLIAQQLENTRLEIEFERQQREVAERRAESLTEGVKVLAGTSAEIKEEIKQLQPKTPNALFTEYKRNRVKVRFDTSFPGIFKDRSKTLEADTILIRDSQQTYAILHTESTPFDLSQITPNYDTVEIAITVGDRVIVPEKVQFMSMDPRIMLIPIDEALIEGSELKVYPLVLEPFRFPKAVVIDARNNYFGESSFKVHPNFSYALEMDRKIISQLFGEFSPSRGDLVIAQTGEFMGVLVNNEYAALMDHIRTSDTIWVGDAFDSVRSNTIITKLSNLVFRTRM